MPQSDLAGWSCNAEGWMFAAFRDRRPWAASLICLVFGPVIGMMYLNRGLYAFLYFIATFAILVGLLPEIAGVPALKAHEVLLNVPFHIVGAVHGILVARGWTDEPRLLKWYAHWYGVVGIG